jgi:NADPH:quinone reductase-like Zn-dependent oxidoreductase
MVKMAAPELQHVFDTVVSPETISKASQCLLNSHGTIATAIIYPGKVQNGVTINSVYSGNIFGRTMAGDVHEAGFRVGKWMWSNLPQWLQRGKLTPLEYEVIGNLEAVEGGLKRMKEHNAQCKLVVNPNK